MAAARYYDWPDGKAHTIPYAQHLRNAGAVSPIPTPGFGAKPAPGYAYGLGTSKPALAAGAAKFNAPAAATPIGGGAPASAATSTPTAPSPLDSQYGSDVAGILFGNKNQRDDLSRQQSQGTEDFNTMLARMADARAKDLQAQNYQANHEGLFYSGQLGKRRDETSKGYDQQQQDAQTSYDRQQTALQQALDRLGTVSADDSSPLGYAGTGQAGLDIANAYSGAIGRRATLDQGYTPPAPAAPAVAAPAAAPAGAIKIAKSAAHGGARWVYRQNANGGWTPIRPA
jgi:hypothetical protein